MNILILASAGPAFAWEESYNSADFDRAVEQAAGCDMEPVDGKSFRADGRRVYVSTQKAAMQTAVRFMEDAEPMAEPLLDEIPLRSYKDSSRPLPLGRWQRMARLQQAMGNRRQAESAAQTRERAEQLIAKLEGKGEDCILVSHPGFLKVLLDRFRAHGYCIARTGLLAIEPLERIVITPRNAHCGGCSHNCLLSNPGCGVGRDKARRHSS